MEIRIRPVLALPVLRSERAPTAPAPRPQTQGREWTAAYRELHPVCTAAFLAHLLTQTGERRTERRTPAHARYPGPADAAAKGRLADVEA